MTARRTVAAAVLIAVVFAGCSEDEEPLPTGADPPSTTTTTAEPTTVAPEETTPSPPAEGAVEVAADVSSRIPAGPHTWQLDVTNVSDAPVQLTFPTSQMGEAILSTEDDAVVHRWSDGRFFTQQVIEITLAPGETQAIELADDLSGVEPGFYEVSLQPSSVTPPAPVTASVRIVEPET